MYRCVNDSFVRLFADDSGLNLFNKNFKCLIEDSKKQIKNLFEWCICNKLTINYDKTCFILFHAKNKKVPEGFDSIEINGTVINRVSSAKYLGLVFDEKLSWRDHVEFICKSLIKFFGIFNHIKSIVSSKIARQLYFAFIYSRVKYGIEVYANCSQDLLGKIQIIQNKLLKLLLNLNRRTNTKDLHVNLNILKVKDIQIVNILCFVNNCLLGKSPEYCSKYFLERTSLYNIRNLGMDISRSKTLQGSLSIQIIGAKLWNALSDELKKICHQQNFKKHVVRFYINKYTEV